MAREKDGWAIVAVALALTAKEDVALIAIPFGLLVWWWFGRRRVGLTIVALSVAALLINFLVLLPHFSPTGALLYNGRYAHLGNGPFDVAVGVFTHPRIVFDAIVDPWHIGYVAAMILPIPLALREPRALAMAIPAVAANFLSSHTYQALINYHYTVYPLIAVVIAGVIGASAATDWSARAKKWVIIASVVASLAFIPMSAAFGFNAEPPAGRQGIEEAIALVPPNAGISAWNRFVPHLTHREIVYEFTNPWVRLNYAAPDLPPPDPVVVEWVLSRRGVDEDLVERLLGSGEFEEVFSGDSFRLLHRIGGGSPGARPSMRANLP